MPLDPHAIEAATVEGRQAGTRADLERRMNALERQRPVRAGAGAPPADLPPGVLYVDLTNGLLYTRIGGVLKSTTFS